MLSTAAGALLAASCALACSRQKADEKATAPVAAPAEAPKGTLALGEPISVPLVPLAEIAKSPARYENTLVTTRGKVTAVCQAMGCWMEIQDESGLAHVKMHGHSFFVPKTAAGHMARVQAKVLRRNDEECDESPPPQHAVAKIELDATGIELD
jgi:Domain of unknown function (DUF4920)